DQDEPARGNGGNRGDEEAAAPEPSWRRRDGEAKELPVIRLNNIQLRDIVDEAVQALERKNTPSSLFKRADGLARIHHDAEHRPIVQAVNESILREKLTRSADFIRVTKKGDSYVQTMVSPTRELAETILALPTWPFPSLAGVIGCPVLRPDGSVLVKPG